jgi:hypothetical protein
MPLLGRTAVHSAFYGLSVLAILYANPSAAQDSCEHSCNAKFNKCKGTHGAALAECETDRGHCLDKCPNPHG